VRDIRVATVQFQHAPGDKPYNLGRVRHFVMEAARASVEIIAFPEMCLTGYWHVRKLSRAAFEALAEPVDGPCTQELLRLSRDHGMSIGAGLLERAPARATALLGAELLLAPHQTGGCNSVSPRGMKPMVVADLDASLLPTSSGRRWLRARRPDLYESLTRPTGQEQETRRVRFGE